LVWSEGRARDAWSSSHDLKTLSGAAVQRHRRQCSTSPKAGGHTGAQSRSTASGESCQRFGVGYGQRSVGPSVHRHVLVKGQGFRHMPGHQRPWSCAQVCVPWTQAGGRTERRYCNPSTLIGWRQLPNTWANPGYNPGRYSSRGLGRRADSGRL
jgi:hypothetical protein